MTTLPAGVSPPPPMHGAATSRKYNAVMRGAVVVAEKFRQQMAGKQLTNKTTGRKLGAVTVSIGVAQYRVGESLSDFIHRADQALYAAKRTGRNKVLDENTAKLATASG